MMLSHGGAFAAGSGRTDNRVRGYVPVAGLRSHFASFVRCVSTFPASSRRPFPASTGCPLRVSVLPVVLSVTPSAWLRLFQPRC